MLVDPRPGSLRRPVTTFHGYSIPLHREGPDQHHASDSSGGHGGYIRQDYPGLKDLDLGDNISTRLYQELRFAPLALNS